MVHQGSITMEGIVTEALPNTLFRVEVTLAPGEKTIILCHLAGKMRLHYIKILPGDNVTVEMTPYDRTRGRIVARGKVKYRQ